MSKQTHAVLLVADISGFTKFMKMHTISLNHAKQIVVRLLKSIINAAKPPLKVAELEGDAVFFYAPCSQSELKKTSERVKLQIIDLFNSFKKELFTIQNMEICECPACMTAGDLRLKQVVHTGETELETINKSSKLFGVDVIVVHRMLKNSVPADEYLMMSNDAFVNFSGFYGLKPREFRENLEGIGEVDTKVFYSDDFNNIPEAVIPEKIKPTSWERRRWKFRTVLITLLEMLKLKEIKGNFRNIPV